MYKRATAIPGRVSSRPLQKVEIDRHRDPSKLPQPKLQWFLTQKSMSKLELRRQADVFTDLAELQSKIGRDPSERAAPREPRHHTPQFVQRAPTVA